MIVVLAVAAVAFFLFLRSTVCVRRVDCVETAYYYYYYRREREENGSSVVVVVVVGVQFLSLSLEHSLSLSLTYYYYLPNFKSVLFFYILVIRGCIMAGVNGLKNNYR